jgi:hypothetical protein
MEESIQAYDIHVVPTYHNGADNAQEGLEAQYIQGLDTQ